MLKKMSKILIFGLVFIFLLSFSSILSAEDTTNSLPSSITDYELSAADRTLMVTPAVCYITSVFYGYVLDPWDNVWSDYYYQAFGGTGFVINPETGHIVTAGHVIDINEAAFKYDLIDAYLWDAYGQYGYLDDWTEADWNWAYENIKVEGSEGPPYDLEVYVQFNTAIASQPQGPGSSPYLRAEVISKSPFEQRDIGIIRITPQTGRALSSAMLGDSSLIEIQQTLTMIGYPWTSEIGQDNSLNPTVTQGSVSGKQMVGGTEWIQIQGDLRQGNSGGPVLNAQGEIIGIVSAGTDNTNNYIRPSNDIKVLLNAENKLGQVDELWKTGLIMFRLQHYSEAIKRFDAVLNLSAGHLLAQEYKAKAQTNMGQDKPLVEATTTMAPDETAATEAISTPESTEKSSKLSTGLLVTIIVVPIVLILAVILILVLVLRKKPQAPVPTQQPPSYQPPPPPQVTTAAGEEKVVEEKKAEEEKEVKKFCSSCGAKVEPDQVFCANCGNKLD